MNTDGERAFCSCINLVEINFQDSNRLQGEASVPVSNITIGTAAFLYCSSLSNVELREGPSNIPKEAFVHCVTLRSLDVPSTVETIGAFTFDGCSLLDEI